MTVPNRTPTAPELAPIWWCELCHDREGVWTGHGHFCEPCRDRVVRKFRTGLLPIREGET